MTSETLRKLLVAGAAVAALSVGACSKPAETVNNTTTVENTTTTVTPDANAVVENTTTEVTNTSTTTNAQ